MDFFCPHHLDEPDVACKKGCMLTLNSRDLIGGLFYAYHLGVFFLVLGLLVAVLLFFIVFCINIPVRKH